MNMLKARGLKKKKKKENRCVKLHHNPWDNICHLIKAFTLSAVTVVNGAAS